MRVVIADDEPVARQVLRELLEDIEGVEVIGEAATGLEAGEVIRECDPDVVFVDLQMPQMDGFTLARGLQGQSAPLVVFVTAYDAHALQAFELGAVDYLLKPVRRERLEAALGKVRRRAAPAVARPPAAGAAMESRKIVGRLGQDFHLLDPSEVIAFHAEGDNVFILCTKGRYLSDHTLRAIQERVPAPKFRRIHRKTIINTDHIRKISPLSSKRWLLRMSNGLEVIVSKRMAGAIREQTQW